MEFENEEQEFDAMIQKADAGQGMSSYQVEAMKNPAGGDPKAAERRLAEAFDASRDVEGSFPVEIQNPPTLKDMKAAFGASRSMVRPLPPTSKRGRERNKPCECGSGKKMKFCCLGRQEMNIQAAVRAQRELRTLAAADALKAYQQAKGLP